MKWRSCTSTGTASRLSRKIHHQDRRSGRSSRRNSSRAWDDLHTERAKFASAASTRRSCAAQVRSRLLRCGRRWMPAIADLASGGAKSSAPAFADRFLSTGLFLDHHHEDRPHPWWDCRWDCVLPRDVAFRSSRRCCARCRGTPIISGGASGFPAEQQIRDADLGRSDTGAIFVSGCNRCRLFADKPIAGLWRKQPTQGAGL